MGDTGGTNSKYASKRDDFMLVFKCECLTEEASVTVRYRTNGEDVIHWMQQAVQPAISEAHRLLSPKCRATRIEYAKMPFAENAPYIGGKPELHS